MMQIKGYWRIIWNNKTELVFETMKAIRLINERKGCSAQYVKLPQIKLTASQV